MGVLRAAEEFFPIVNALRPLMLGLDERGVDALDLLASWAKWIVEKNQTRHNTHGGLYHGSIGDFLEFVRSYLEGRDNFDPVIEEMVRWEVLKNLVRAQSDSFTVNYGQLAWRIDRPKGELTLARKSKDNQGRLYTNPSIVLGDFKYPHLFSSNFGKLEPGTFAFYRREDGTPAIVRLPSITCVVLQLAKGGVSFESVLDAFSHDAGDVPLVASEVADLLGQLESAQLLVKNGVTPGTAKDETRQQGLVLPEDLGGI